MTYDMYTVIPPRPTFAADMTETESAIISKHVAYRTDLLDKDVAVASGLVADPSGLYGMAVVEAWLRCLGRARRGWRWTGRGPSRP